jgi:hypothetical protein
MTILPRRIGAFASKMCDAGEHLYCPADPKQHQEATH